MVFDANILVWNTIVLWLSMIDNDKKDWLNESVLFDYLFLHGRTTDKIVGGFFEKILTNKGA